MQKAQLLAVAAATVVACSDAFSPTVQNVSGFYFADTFTTDSAGVSKDWVAVGATFGVVLNPDGSMHGRLMLPGVPPDTATFTADLTGTWTLTGDTVRFTQDADTFVRDMDWVVTKGHLAGEETFSGVTIRAVLGKVQFP